MLTASDAKIVAANGGGLDLDAGTYTASDLKIIAANGKSRSSPLVLRNAKKLTVSDVKIIAANSPGNVTFVY